MTLNELNDHKGPVNKIWTMMMDGEMFYSRHTAQHQQLLRNTVSKYAFTMLDVSECTFTGFTIERQFLSMHNFQFCAAQRMFFLVCFYSTGQQIDFKSSFKSREHIQKREHEPFFKVLNNSETVCKFALWLLFQPPSMLHSQHYGYFSSPLPCSTPTVTA